MKKILYILIPTALIAIVIVKLMMNRQTSQDRVYHHNTEQPVKVGTMTVEVEPLNQDLIFSGTFAPYRETKINAEVQGKVSSVPAALGSNVKQGDPLVLLDHSLLSLQLESASVQVEGLEADVKRYTALAEADAIQGIQLEKSQLALREARIRKSTLEEQIRMTTIRAPFAGIVTAQLTEAGAFASPGVPLVQLTDISRLKFTIQITERDLEHFSSGKKMTVTADIFPDHPLSGEVTLVGSRANNGNSFPVEFTVRNTNDQKIKAGMFGKVELQGEEGDERKAIYIPVSAVTGEATSPEIFLVKNKKAIKQRIVTGSLSGNRITVTEGLKEGDVVVTEGMINLFDNAPVEAK